METPGQWLIYTVSIVTCALVVFFVTASALARHFPIPSPPPPPPPLPGEIPMGSLRIVGIRSQVRWAAVGAALVAGWGVAGATSRYGFVIFPVCTMFWGMVVAIRVRDRLMSRGSYYLEPSVQKRILGSGAGTGLLVGLAFYWLVRG